MPRIEPIRSRYHLDALEGQQVQAIREATLHVLEHTGVHMPSELSLIHI